ncbi:Putative ribonuclease H protein [Dendrobium catenatum]|uniref:Ribonuclease H protein n=1 Tax=Dendrobium catenatum TaxID=906689 RepID=A0A2I0VX15_9ASPA|nr:Putative ribonuclease H protein [Dendrobium catenatum]
MDCVTNPIFMIQVNGVILDKIVGKSGFRQGCPLSPYLFIICSQLLSNAFKFKGDNLGLKIAPLAPRISHLLYADDILIFSNTKEDNIKKIKKIMEKYCCWTGQIINKNKSSLIFSKNTCRRRKKKISMLLGIKESKDLYYLGIKLTQRRRSASDFLHILEKASSKLNIWGKKFISTVGRITLIKSVIQALPVYYSSLSLVPISVLKKLDKMCRDFLWKKGDGNNGLNYVAWKDLCKPLKLGGMGIQSAVESVEPLRAKLVWKFHNEPNSLLSKSIYAKHGKQFLHPMRSQNPSPTWKLYLSGAKALKNIVKWKIKDGISINIMKDIWLLDRKLECWPTFISNDIDNIPNLSNFITEGSWNAEKLSKYFGVDLVKLICNQKIDNDNPEDKLELLNSHSGFTLSAMAKNANSKKIEIDLH